MSLDLAKEPFRSFLRDSVLAIVLMHATTPGAAAPFEIKVHDDLITAESEQVLSFHSNYAEATGNTDGGQSRSFQSMLEYSYGLTRNAELGVHLFASHFGGSWHANGAKVAHQYVPPHDEEGFWHYSIKNEITYLRPAGSLSETFYELTPIVGIAYGSWRMTLNPGLNVPIRAGYKQVLFEPAVKIGYSLTRAATLGTEYYMEAGPLSRMLPHSRRDETAYLVLDARLGKAGLNLGVGKGTNNVGDRWIVKMIVDCPL